ncbi:MAG: hypothetical protein PHN64_05955 [Desulfovibrionaceae bacterium]|nr:hypothetical protein [Desulfovibrionaceae bacterium]
MDATVTAVDDDEKIIELTDIIEQGEIEPKAQATQKPYSPTLTAVPEHETNDATVVDLNKKLAPAAHDEAELQALLDKSNPLHQGLVALLRTVVSDVFDEKQRMVDSHAIEQRFDAVEHAFADIAARVGTLEQHLAHTSQGLAQVQQSLSSFAASQSPAQAVPAPVLAQCAALDARCTALEAEVQALKGSITAGKPDAEALSQLGQRLCALADAMEAKVEKKAAEAVARILREEIAALQV